MQLTRHTAVSLLAILTVTVAACRSSGDDSDTETRQDAAETNETTTTSTATSTETTGTTVVISPHDQCFDQYLSAEPVVFDDQRYYVEAGETATLNRIWPVGTIPDHALFILNDDGQDTAAYVKFSYSDTDALTIHDVRDGDCEEIEWDQEGNSREDDGHLRRSTISLLVDDDTTYNIDLTIRDIVSQPQDVIIRKEYSASVEQRD